MSRNRDPSILRRAVSAAVRATAGAAVIAAKLPSRNLEHQPRFAGQVSNMLREALNDVRGKIHESCWGVPEGTQGIGTPMSPTPMIVTDRTYTGVRGIER